jgi:hypothetical protein
MAFLKDSRSHSMYTLVAAEHLVQSSEGLCLVQDSRFQTMVRRCEVAVQ